MRGMLKLIVLLVVSFAAVASCGASDEPPKPLGAHYDDMYIAGVPLDQKQAMIQSQQDWNVARMQNANADSQERDAETQLHQAHNDQKAAQLGIDSAASNKKSADQSADMNRINQATKELTTARDLEKATGARVRYVEAYVRYLRRYVRWTQENMYYREAQYENTKAQIGQHNNIAPKGVTYPSFPKQMEEREHRTATAKGNYEDLMKAARNERDNWLKLQTAADQENGHPGVYWDPLATKSNAPPAASPPPPAPAPAPEPAPPSE
jgi:hypothetical protein